MPSTNNGNHHQQTHDATQAAIPTTDRAREDEPVPVPWIDLGPTIARCAAEHGQTAATRLADVLGTLVDDAWRTAVVVARDDAAVPVVAGALLATSLLDAAGQTETEMRADDGMGSWLRSAADIAARSAIAGTNGDGRTPGS